MLTIGDWIAVCGTFLAMGVFVSMEGLNRRRLVKLEEWKEECNSKNEVVDKVNANIDNFNNAMVRRLKVLECKVSGKHKIRVGAYTPDSANSLFVCDNCGLAYTKNLSKIPPTPEEHQALVELGVMKKGKK